MESFSDFPAWAVKLIGTILLLLLSMIFGAIPLKLSRDENQISSRRNLLISLSNCFAGGVFFSTVILDLIPMVEEEIKDALNAVSIETEFPLGEFIIGLGFIMMLILEQFVHTCCRNSFLSHPGHSHHEDNVYQHDKIDETKALLPNCNLGFHHNEVHTESVGEQDIEPSQESHHSVHSHSSQKSYDTFYSDGGTKPYIAQMKRSKSLASMQSFTHSNFRTYVLVFAISLHSLFEGLSVGLISVTQTLLNIFVALLIHKSIIAFSIGVQLVDADFRSIHVLICLFIFASMTPLGVGVGVLVLDYLNSVIKIFCSAILQAIATGTFLYVTFFEVLPHELNIQDNKKPLKIVFVLFGYALTTGVCYYENRFHKITHPNFHNGTTLLTPNMN